MTEPELPSLFVATDAAANEAQTSFRRWYLVQLVGLLAAAVAGAASALFSKWDVAPYVIGVGFLMAMGARVYLLKARPEKRWYDARAAAESSKSLAWRYATKGEPFFDSDNADDLFVARLDEILEDLPNLTKPAEGAQITDWMRDTRSGSIADRISGYRIGRLEEQQGWYAGNAANNDRQARRWGVAIIGFEFVVGLVALFRIGDPDVFGLFSALSAAIIAWVQSHQFETLNRAYSVASHELSSILALLPDPATCTEERWAAFVDKAEEAISREHKVWRASRIPEKGV